LALNYDTTWVLQLPALGEGLARIHIEFPSIGAIRGRSCAGTLEGRIVVPRWTDRAGTDVREGRCGIERLGDTLRFDARLPFRTELGAASLSVQCLAYGPPQDETIAHVRLDGVGIGPQEGMTQLHLPRFLAELATEPDALQAGPRPIKPAGAPSAWPRLKRQLGQAGWLLGWNRMGLPADTVQFLRQRVRSVEQLEVLLWLHREPERWWHATEVAQTLYASVDSVDRSLNRLVGHRLAEVRHDPEPAYRFAAHAQGPEVDQLAKAYQEHRVAVLTAIAMGPINEVQSFADAFRWRRGEDP
jgi:hypothetical protein